MSGLVQRLEVEADSRSQLVHAVSICLTWHKSVSHFIAGADFHGTPFLSLLWASDGKEAQPLIAPLSDAGAVTSQIESWLATVEYGNQPDHDGSNSKGYRISCDAPQTDKSGWRKSWASYVSMTIYPAWIEYHK